MPKEDTLSQRSGHRPTPLGSRLTHSAPHREAAGRAICQTHNPCRFSQPLEKKKKPPVNCAMCEAHISKVCAGLLSVVVLFSLRDVDSLIKIT